MQLVEEGELEKIAGGLYYAPKQTAFGKAPADENELVRAFLKDNRFVITSPNDYNLLGVGTTQLYNELRVYNYKRHGEFELGKKKYRFIRKPHVPAKLTQEFLAVDLVNNLNKLEEDENTVLENLKRKVAKLNKAKLKRTVQDFGLIRTKKIFAKWINK